MKPNQTERKFFIVVTTHTGKAVRTSSSGNSSVAVPLPKPLLFLLQHNPKALAELAENIRPHFSEQKITATRKRNLGQEMSVSVGNFQTHFRTGLLAGK